jgi:TonB family protein
VLLGLVVLGLALVGYNVYKMSQRPRIYVLAPPGQETPGPDEAPELTGPSVEVPSPPTPPVPPRVPHPPPPPPSLGETPAPAPPEELAKPPQRISSRQLYANAIRRVALKYPPIARSARVRGSVEVEVVVDENGDVTSATVISGHPLLREAALEAAWQWKFNPFLQDDEPISVTGVLIFGERARMLNRLLREH